MAIDSCMGIWSCGCRGGGVRVMPPGRALFTHYAAGCSASVFRRVRA